MHKNLYLMVGIAGSGKSTWLKNNIEEDSVIISRDQIRFRKIQESDEYFAREDEVYEEYVNMLWTALQCNVKNVYADATHLTGKSRNRLLSRLINNQNKDDIDIKIIFINTPIEKCIEQDSKRTGRAQVGESVIRNQYNQLVIPTYNERHKYKDILEVIL